MIASVRQIVGHGVLAGGRSTETTASRMALNAASVNFPTDFVMSDWLAVKSFPGRAKLATNKPPELKSGEPSGSAAGSP